MKFIKYFKDKLFNKVDDNTKYIVTLKFSYDGDLIKKPTEDYIFNNIDFIKYKDIVILKKYTSYSNDKQSNIQDMLINDIKNYIKLKIKKIKLDFFIDRVLGFIENNSFKYRIITSSDMSVFESKPVSSKINYKPDIWIQIKIIGTNNLKKLLFL